MPNDPGTANALHDLRSELVEFRAEVREMLRGMTKQCNEHDMLLSGDGNGHKGLIVRTDRLEQQQARREQHFWVLWGAVMTSVGSAIYAFFHGKQP